MERFSKRENVLVGREHTHHNPRRSFENYYRTNSQVDFSDVFGGPPRRFSDTILSSNQRFRSSEKKSFSEDTANRDRGLQNGFFDDIFRGNESHASPGSCSIPRSCTLSPSVPQPPKAEPFDSLLPPKFRYSNIQAKLSKAVDFPAVLLSGKHNKNRSKDGTLNEANNSYAATASPSRFSTQGLRVNDELKKDIRLRNHHTLLCDAFALNIEESPNISKSNGTALTSNSRKDLNIVETANNSCQFHFSMYKWAGRGVSLLMPLRGENNSKLKEKRKTKRRLSSSENIEGNDAIGDQSQKTQLPEKNDFCFHNQCSSEDNHQIRVENKKKSQKKGNLSEKDCVKASEIVHEAASDIPECNNIYKAILMDGREKQRLYSWLDVGFCEENEMKTPKNAHETCNPRCNKKINVKDELEELSGLSIGLEKNATKTYGKGNGLNLSKVKADDLKGLQRDSGDGFDKGRSVKKSLKTNNQKASFKTNHGIKSGSGLKSGVKVHITPMEKKGHKTDDSTFTVEEDRMKWKNEKQNSGMRSSVHINGNVPVQKDLPRTPGSVHIHSKTTSHKTFQGNIMSEEGSQDQGKVLAAVEAFKDFQAADNKIRQWSNGKKGNIRSLLSTLQYVLWAESGWKPMPLVDMIEGSAVKRAYQKALLCLHPDKLQQKNAATHQKYIAEKVFDILQEAWDHFNSIASL